MRSGAGTTEERIEVRGVDNGVDEGEGYESNADEASGSSRESRGGEKCMHRFCTIFDIREMLLFEEHMNLTITNQSSHNPSH